MELGFKSHPSDVRTQSLGHSMRLLSRERQFCRRQIWTETAMFRKPETLSTLWQAHQPGLHTTVLIVFSTAAPLGLSIPWTWHTVLILDLDNPALRLGISHPVCLPHLNSLGEHQNVRNIASLGRPSLTSAGGSQNLLVCSHYNTHFSGYH